MGPAEDHHDMEMEKRSPSSSWHYAVVRKPFQIITITLLSLLLPLSFLLLARLSTAYYLIDVSAYPSSPDHEETSSLFSFFLRQNPTLLHLLISVVTVATLVYALNIGRESSSSSTNDHQPPAPAAAQSQPRLYFAWILLCTLQVCVGLGIEGSIAAGVEGSSFGQERSLLCRVVFFLGLHETMLFWSRSVVKPVVDNTVFGMAVEERWVERVAMAMSFGFLWWWRLRNEVEALVSAAEVKRKLLPGIGAADIICWWLYYVTVTIGVVRIFKSLVWIGIVFFFRRTGGNSGHESRGNDEKV